MPENATLTIALVGNPNSGKTTIFNALTGSRQHVGNYPGVTVEKKFGTATYEGNDVEIVDLPGTYSLTAYSIEEIIARDFVIDTRPDVVVDIVDASNLERNLYLATQLLELHIPVVLAFNMSDVAEARGFLIDTEMLSRLLGVPIVSTVGHKGRGVSELLAVAVEAAHNGPDAVSRQRQPDFGSEVEPHVAQLTALVATEPAVSEHARWYATKLFENDAHTIERLSELAPGSVAVWLDEAGRLRRHVEKLCGDAAEIVLADRRYGFISGACTEAVAQTVETRHAYSDQIDAVLTHRVLGLPFFAGLMYAMFWGVFTLGAEPMTWIEGGFGWLAGIINGFWTPGSESLLRSLLVDGVIGGVGGVLIFVPNIILLFLAIAVLEDTGYMARAAFIMDRLMHKIGLHGKSFIPLLTGFGCSVPAIMATRTLESRRDRLVTMLVVPLMSCGARLPIYILIVPAFFPKAWQAPVLWSIYVIGVALAIVCAKLLRATLFRGESVPFVMELPPYRVPTIRGLLVHMWEPTMMYVRKAGTVILGFAILMWAVTTFPQKTQYDHDYDAMLAAEQARVATEVKQLNPQLGLPTESDALIEALDAGAGPDGAAQRFGAAVDAVAKMRQEFDQLVDEEGLVSESSAYATAAQNRDAALATASLEDPEAFAAAATYLDDIQAPSLQRRQELDSQKQQEELAYTLAGRVGRLMAPAIRPLGFDWKIGTALIGALGAKEVFVAQLGIVYSVGAKADSESLRTRLQADYTRLTAYCIMLFCLATAPCMATIAVTRRESGSWKWALFQLLGLTILAYTITLIVYQVGRLFV